MINWNPQRHPYPSWQAGQLSPALPVYALPNTSVGQTLPPSLPGDDDGDYFYTITNW